MSEKKSKLVEIKTKPTAVGVNDFINTFDEQKRIDCHTLVAMMQKATGAPAVLWGSSIIGFGNRTYESPKTGRAVDWFVIGFAPRKANLSLYISIGMAEHTESLKKLGKHKTGKGCLYINKLDDVDVSVLEGIIKETLKKREA